MSRPSYPLPPSPQASVRGMLRSKSLTANREKKLEPHRREVALPIPANQSEPGFSRRRAFEVKNHIRINASEIRGSFFKSRPVPPNLRPWSSLKSIAKTSATCSRKFMAPACPSECSERKNTRPTESPSSIFPRNTSCGSNNAHFPKAASVNSWLTSAKSRNAAWTPSSIRCAKPTEAAPS